MKVNNFNQYTKSLAMFERRNTKEFKIKTGSIIRMAKIMFQ
jgi:hypothetical protein